MLMKDDEPTTYKEVLNSSELVKWLNAMRSEMDSIYVNQVWTLIDPSKEIKPIRYKSVFKKKTNLEGDMDP